MLKATGIEDKDARIIGNLYWYQTAAVRVGHQLTEEVEMKRGVRQECILSLISTYTPKKFSKRLDMGIEINGRIINNIRYADDTIILARTSEELQILMKHVANACGQFGLKINKSKTKYMIISKNNIIQNNGLQVNGTQLERVPKATYLGSNINERWDPSIEIKIRIERTQAAFLRMKRTLIVMI